jgi:SP family sugar:H+ symporter-like MFS transporter
VTALQQSLISLTSLFIAVGSILSGVVGNYFGRRGTIQAGSLVVLSGAAGMLGTAGNFANYMACKSINGLGQGLLLAGTITWGVESMPPQRRGFFSLYITSA